MGSTDEKQKNESEFNSTLDDAIAKVPMPGSDRNEQQFPSNEEPAIDERSKEKRERSRREHHRPKQSIIALVIIIIAIVAIGIVGWKMGYLYGGAKTPEQKVTVNMVVCDKDIVNEYNRIVLPVTQLPEDALSDLVNRIRSKSDYAKDPTCQTIIFQYEFTAGNQGEMKNAAEAIRDLNDQGIFANNDIIGALSVFVMVQLAVQGDGTDDGAAE